jgi:hypothetical protein
MKLVVKHTVEDPVSVNLLIILPWEAITPPQCR